MCVPCHAGTPPLDAGQVEVMLEQLDNWRLEDGRLVKNHAFADFMAAVRFVDSIAVVAEAQGHHPDLELGWGYVRVRIWTHAIGGLSENDFILAARIDSLRSGT